ncbi:MAG TPA: ACT domain-containing protein [Candidatus Sulfopaludibacter sp.]|jgi:hypothetical protein|nr:ACT domain-containing protein [Candidatus Sulfopaludibacter sp.]
MARIQLLPQKLAVCRLGPDDAIPAWAAGDFLSISRTADELSIVCHSTQVPNAIRREGDWLALKVIGPLDFALTGVLLSLAAPLAEAGVSIFAISTFDTDYVLVKQPLVERAMDALRRAGHEVSTPDMLP